SATPATRSRQGMVQSGVGQALESRAVLHPAIGVEPNVEIEAGYITWDVRASRERLEPISGKRARVIPADRNDCGAAALHRFLIVPIEADVEADHLKFKRGAF